MKAFTSCQVKINITNKFSVEINSVTVVKYKRKEDTVTKNQQNECCKDFGYEDLKIYKIKLKITHNYFEDKIYMF